MSRRCVAIVVLLVLASCSGRAGETTTTSISSDWTTYSDDDARFQITFPEEWRPNPNEEAPVGVLFFVGTTLTELTPSVTLAVLENSIPEGADVDQLASATRPQYAPVFVVTDEVEAVVGGRDAVLFHIAERPTEDQKSRVGIQLLTVVGSSGWTASCMVEVFDESLIAGEVEICDSVVRTLKITTPTGLTAART